MNLALGLIETKGLVGAIEAADAMVKAADVKLVSKEKVTGALMVIKVVGDVAAVKSAVDAGSVAAQRVGELISSHVIPRPDDQIDQLIFNRQKQGRHSAEKQNEVVPKTKPPIKNEVKSEPSFPKITEPKDVITKNESSDRLEKKKVKVESSGKSIPPKEELNSFNVHQLRKLARTFENFPIHGREISKANRQLLLDYFNELR
ncbi:ethanolamine utilization protein EutM precursor [bacterium BMS3Abin04]|nr:ethanolamine utilization protein EutM precursor [bacterium BMS3Abin04]